MKLSHKIWKLGAAETYLRSWRRIQRLAHPIRIGPMLDCLDQSKIQSIQERYRDSTAHYAKYVDISRWLALNVKRVQDLKLHRSSPISVLDLGCGGGFLLYILQQLGHDCLGSDIDEFPLFTELLDLFHVSRITWRIEPFQSLPDFGRQFDLITAFSTAFNRNDQRTVWWGPEQWRFFLDDLKSRLKIGGRIFVGLNPDNTGCYYTPELLEFFLSRGAVVERENVIFPC